MELRNKRTKKCSEGEKRTKERTLKRKKGRERDAGERKTEGTRQTVNEVVVGRFLRSSRESGRISEARRERELKNGMKHYWISTGQSGKLNSAMFCISITDEISASQKSSRKSVMFCKHNFNASSCSQAWQKVCAKFQASAVGFLVAKIGAEEVGFCSVKSVMFQQCLTPFKMSNV